MQSTEKVRRLVLVAALSAACGILVATLAARAGHEALALAAMGCATIALVALDLVVPGSKARRKLDSSARTDSQPGCH